MRKWFRFYLILCVMATGGMLCGGRNTEVRAVENSDGSVAVDEVNFPDASFREYVRRMFDKNENRILEKEEREIVYEMSVGEEKGEEGEGFWSGTYSLQGIEYFANLERLYISEVSKLSGKLPELPKLWWITIADVKDREIDLNAWHQKLPLMQIKSLELKNFRKGDLDLKSMEQLEDFYLSVDSDVVKDGLPRPENEYFLGTIRTKGNKKLKSLSISDVKLKELDLSGNEQLESIQLFDFSIKKKTLNISGKNRLTGITIGMARDLESLMIKGNKKLDHIWLEKMNRLKKLELSGNNRLKKLRFIIMNGLKTIDLSKNKKIESIDITNVNALKKLDVTKNPYLKSLSISGKGPQKLDLSKNRRLRELQILDEKIHFTLPKNNKLSKLIVSASGDAKIDLTSCVGLKRINSFSYGYGAKVKMKRSVFEKRWKSRKLKIYDNSNRKWYTVKNKKVKIPKNGDYVWVEI